MFGMNASDLHLTANHKPLVRLHGDMMELPDQPVITPERMKKLITAIMPEHNKAQFEETARYRLCPRDRRAWPGSASMSSWTGSAWAPSSARSPWRS